MTVSRMQLEVDIFLFKPAWIQLSCLCRQFFVRLGEARTFPAVLRTVQPVVSGLL